jgi:NAD(P)-dependent dehydrogenase (short-subunit alcohol dehydrogenase family)
MKMVDKKRFDGRVAAVTGAARGIGKAVATHMAQQGAAVALLDIDESVKAVADELAGQGFRALGGWRTWVGKPTSDRPWPGW